MQKTQTCWREGRQWDTGRGYDDRRFTVKNRKKHAAFSSGWTTYHANCFVQSILRHYLPDVWNDL